MKRSRQEWSVVGLVLVGALLMALLQAPDLLAQLAAGTVNAKQSGAWTVQPGNTANTTPWLVNVNAALPTGSNTIGKVDAGVGPATAWKVDLSTTAANATAIKVDGSAVTQPVTFGGNGTLFAGQTAVTASAAALTSNSAKTVCVKALAGNTIPVYIGPSSVTTANGMELQPGDSQCLPLSNSNLVYVIASTTGASVSWDGTN